MGREHHGYSTRHVPDKESKEMEFREQTPVIVGAAKSEIHGIGQVI